MFCIVLYFGINILALSEFQVLHDILLEFYVVSIVKCCVSQLVLYAFFN